MTLSTLIGETGLTEIGQDHLAKRREGPDIILARG
jgi:hypothetical protein